MATSRAKLPSTVNTNSVTGKTSITTQERVPFTKISLSSTQIAKPDGSVDINGLVRVMNQMQDNTADATLAARSHPQAIAKTIQNIAMTGPSLGNVTTLLPGSPAVTFSGTPTGNYTISIRITTAGTLGSAMFEWSTDGGASYPNKNVPTGSNVVLGTTGVTASFSSGNYSGPSPADVYVVTTTSKPVTINHGLGSNVGSWTCTRTYPNSTPFHVVEAQYNTADWPSNLDQTQYIVLYPCCTGTYDIQFSPA